MMSLPSSLTSSPYLMQTHFIYNLVGRDPPAYRPAGDHADQMVRSGTAPYRLRDYFTETSIRNPQSIS